MADGGLAEIGLRRSRGRVLTKSALCKRASVNARFAAKATEVLRCCELT
jgi:hypothetical protein